MSMLLIMRILLNLVYDVHTASSIIIELKREKELLFSHITIFKLVKFKSDMTELALV